MADDKNVNIQIRVGALLCPSSLVQDVKVTLQDKQWMRRGKHFVERIETTPLGFNFAVHVSHEAALWFDLHSEQLVNGSSAAADVMSSSSSGTVEGAAHSDAASSPATATAAAAGDSATTSSSSSLQEVPARLAELLRTGRIVWDSGRRCQLTMASGHTVGRIAQFTAAGGDGHQPKKQQKKPVSKKKRAGNEDEDEGEDEVGSSNGKFDGAAPGGDGGGEMDSAARKRVRSNDINNEGDNGNGNGNGHDDNDDDDDDDDNLETPAAAAESTTFTQNPAMAAAQKAAPARFRFVELFAGIGGFRVGLERLGGECVFASEWDPSCCATYRTNFGDNPAGDITHVDEKAIPPHDILTAGFPCQSFSRAGALQGFDDSRGQLFFEIPRVLKYHRPRAFLLENVANLLKIDQGRDMKRIVHELRACGYVVHHAGINSKTVVPQQRVRLFIVGLLKEAVQAPEIFHWPEVSWVLRCV